MAKKMSQLGHPLIKLKGKIPEKDTYFLAARFDEGLSRLTEGRVVFATKTADLALDTLLGTLVTVELETSAGGARKFHGTCVQIEHLGIIQGYDMFALDTRPWTWFLSLASDNRIFQSKSIPDIIEAVFSEHGFSDFGRRLSGSYTARTYVVQYNETDLDFVHRLMEEEGIYYYFDHTGTVPKLVLSDGLGSHDPIAETPELAFQPQVERSRRHIDHIFEWGDRQKVVPGKVSLIDYNPLTSKTKLASTAILKKGKHTNNDFEHYVMSGRYEKVADGDTYARIGVERAVQDYQRWLGAGNARNLAAGGTVKLKEHPRPTPPDEYLIITATHHLVCEVDRAEPGEVEAAIANLGLTDPAQEDAYLCRFECGKKTDPYRPPAITPWPDLSGLHTAEVTGPSGEEIHTDEYGRIKVQFHWDRDGKKDDKTTCWVPVMHPWAGKNYGMVHIPRIGQEVVIQFERDNPNRPVCIGMLYNDVNRHPWTLPDNMTQTGVKTESSKGGGGYNELMFEDKKDAELVRMQAEKDYDLKIKNNANITIGLEKKDKGRLTEQVHGNVTETYGANHTYTLSANLTETIKEGDHTYQIDKGSKFTSLIEGNYDIYLEKGGMQTYLIDGDYDVFVDKGVVQFHFKDGDFNTFVDKGKMYTKVSDEIKFECGSSSLTMKKDGTIELKGKDITIDGSGNVTIKAGMDLKAKGEMNLTAEAGMSGKFKGGIDATLEGGATAVVKGGMVQIN